MKRVIPAAWIATLMVCGPALASDVTDADGLALVNRLSWGASARIPDGLSALQWLDQQLHPSQDDGLPQQVQARIDAMDISHAPLTDIAAQLRELQLQIRAARDRGKDTKAARMPYQQMLVKLALEAQTRSLLRDLYSRNQLKERLDWFWLNHFNVYARKREIGGLIGDFDETAIRPHVLGKFRDLLASTVFHPAMIQYLDNQQNAAGKINENYAREIMELHTMGVGSGYTQKDVQELARILTGVGVNMSGRPRRFARFARAAYRTNVGDGGLFEFIPKRHDYGDKVFLGHTIKGSGLDEVRQAIDILASQPATARHISTELAQYFCCDAPSEALVDAMSAAFLKSDGDIAAVLRTLVASPQFAASLGKRFKDPMQWTVSALRASFGDRVITNMLPVAQMLNRLGEPLYGHETPDGYSMTKAAWAGPGQMQTRFEIARQIGAGAPRLFMGGDDGVMTASRPPALDQTAYFRSLRLADATRAAIAQGASQVDRNMLFLSSPDFMRN
ncbi:MAG: hypothetical protein BGN85_05845 [Alphaproteobacteria bacterium 64-11]|nr:DUF1800 domain-containing protein [Alphaproteobacteria bacterium]OJU11735.1 MAG: hypothetical protein BGN85_05845 [Alphaproteobacteria bacterium 64-11]